jgi:hypothetical protein
MDKNRKLKRYRRKDYTHVVEFPVEIIGRDGVVRRFSFEESVRLYQRRIASADVRYRDSEVIEAERAHCLHRIEQLRRSYFVHFGWPAVEVVDDGADEVGRLSGEVAAFLRRCLSGLYPDLQRFVISFLDSRPAHKVFFVVPPAAADAEIDAPLGHFLLYVYRFTSAEPEGNRDAFFEFIKVLDSIRGTGGDDLELLIAFHHTTDCGLILTGSTRVQDAPEGELKTEDLDLSWADEEVVQIDRLDEALVLVRKGLFEAALERFVSAYSQQHYQRTAYLGAAVIGDLLGRDEEAETAAIMGTRYFPGDPALQYHHALNRLRAGAHADARRALGACSDWSNGRGSVALLQGLIALDTGRLRSGEALLKKIVPSAFGTDTHLVQALRWFLAQLAARRLLRLTAAVAILGTLAYSAAALRAGAPGAAALSGLLTGGCLLLRYGAHRAWRRQLSRHLRGPAGRRMNLTSTSVLSRSSTAEAPQ